MTSDSEPTAILSGLPLDENERDRICANWRAIVAKGDGESEDGSTYTASVRGGTLYIMPEPMTVEEWEAKYGRAAW